MRARRSLLAAVCAIIITAPGLFMPSRPTGAEAPADSTVQILYSNEQRGMFTEDEEGIGGLRPIADWTASRLETCHPPAASARDCNIVVHYGNLTGAADLPKLQKAMQLLRQADWPGHMLLAGAEEALLQKWHAPEESSIPPRRKTQKPPRQPEGRDDLHTWATARALRAGTVSMHQGGELQIAMLGFRECRAATPDAFARMGKADLYVILLPGPECLPAPSVPHRYHALTAAPFDSRAIFLYPAPSNRFSRDVRGSYSCGSRRQEVCRLRLHFNGHNLRGVENSFETFREDERNHPLPPARSGGARD